MMCNVRKFLCVLLTLCLLLPALPHTAAAEPETVAPVETEAPEATVPETAEPSEAPQEDCGGFSAPYQAYFGLLHAHTGISDGKGTVEEAFSHAAGVEGLDFFAVTDHSDSFDNAAAGAITEDGTTLSEEWAAGRAAAAAVTTAEFLGLFGFEMSWPEDKRLGHITTFGTPGWVSQNQAAYATATTALKTYYETLTTVPGSVSQFCHPGERYGNFDRFGYWKERYDDSVHLLEVASGEEGTAWSQYPAALDAGWHVVPTISQNNHSKNWGDADDSRTVVLAERLTEADIFDAIRRRRVYATQDKDLHLYFTLNGYELGEIMPVEEDLQIDLTWYDPTDKVLGKVEVVTEGGQVLTSRTAETEELSIPVAAGFRYYYLRITQPDGDIAITAPVWVDVPDNVEITEFEASAETLDQGDTVTLRLTLENATREDITPEAVELYLGQTRAQSMTAPKAVPAGGSRTYAFDYTHPEAGRAELRVRVRAKGDTFEERLDLEYQPRQTVTGLLIDGSHENEGLDSLDALKALAAEAGMTVTTFTEEMPRGGEILLIPQPKTALEAAFIQDVKAFLETGGKLILWGPGSEELLEALNSPLALAGEAAAGTAKTFRTQEPWCEDVVEGQYFTHGQGRAVTGGRWLVKSGSQPVLAWEETAWGGGIFLAGCDLFQPAALAKADSLWELPQANRTILLSILGQPEPLLPLTDIQDVRKGTQGQQYRIKGYVTAGTSNPGNVFPDTIYIQDDTGGIAVTDFAIPGVQVGEPVELMGTLTQVQGNPALKYENHSLPGGIFHHYDPDVRYCKAATDYAALGGQVVKIQGKATSLTQTEDKKGIRRLVVKDSWGDTAIVEIEDFITSGSTGKNELAKEIKKDRTVEAMGILHINAKGETVLRVRDCDEVLYIPPEPDKTNPKTGDRFWWLG